MNCVFLADLPEVRTVILHQIQKEHCHSLHQAADADAIYFPFFKKKSTVQDKN